MAVKASRVQKSNFSFFILNNILIWLFLPISVEAASAVLLWIPLLQFPFPLL